MEGVHLVQRRLGNESSRTPMCLSRSTRLSKHGVTSETDMFRCFRYIAATIVATLAE